MKTCPKCNKKYDNSWETCLACRVGLIPEQSSKDSMFMESANKEIMNIRADMARLKMRLDSLETAVSNKIGKPVSSTERIEEKVLSENDAFNEKNNNIVKDDTSKTEKEDAEKNISASLFKPGEKGEKKQSWFENFEQVLGGKWFNKLGTLAVVVGMALLLGYSFRYMGAAAKIGIGFIIGAGLIGFGIYTEKKENLVVYGRTLIGGGWALNYFTAFAMHHIPTVQLIKSPLMGFLFLILVSIASIAHIYRYRSEFATGFSYLLMFTTLMIAPMNLYSLLASGLAAVSLLYFMYKMNWNKFLLYGMTMSYLCFMAFLAKAPMMAATDMRFYGILSILGFYWFLFTAGALSMKKEEKNTELDTKHIALMGNSLLAFFSGSLLVVNGYADYLFHFLWAGIISHLLLTAVLYYYKQREPYIISSAYLGVFAVLFAAHKYSGYSLTLALIVLAQLLLLAGILLKEKFWRQTATAFLVFIFAKILFIDSLIGRYIAEAANKGAASGSLGLSGRSLLFMFTFIFFFFNQYYYQRVCKKWKIANDERNFPVLLSYTYPAIFALGTWLDMPKVLTAPAWIIFGVILLQWGVSSNDYHKRIQGYALTVGSFARLLMSNMIIQGGISIFSYRLLTVVPVALILYYCQTLYQEIKTKNLILSKERKMEVIYTYLVFGSIFFLLRYELPAAMVAPAWGMLALIYALRNIKTQRPYYLVICSITAFAAAGRAIFINILRSEYLAGFESSLIYPVITVVMLYTGNYVFSADKDKFKDPRITSGGRIKNVLRSAQLVYALLATTVLTAIVVNKTSGSGLTVSLAIEGLSLFLAGFALKEKNWRILGLLILLITLIKTFLIDLRQLETLYYILSVIVLGIVLLFVSFIYAKYKETIKKFI